MPTAILATVSALEVISTSKHQKAIVGVIVILVVEAGDFPFLKAVFH